MGKYHSQKTFILAYFKQRCIKDSLFAFLGFWNGVLLLATGASAGLDIYKLELGCKKETPQLQKNVNKINRKQAELVEMKDDINLRWIPGK